MKRNKKIIFSIGVLVILVGVILLIINLSSANKNSNSNVSNNEIKVSYEYDEEFYKNMMKQQGFVSGHGTTVFFNIYSGLKETEESTSDYRIFEKEHKKVFNGVDNFELSVTLLNKTKDEYMEEIEEKWKLLEDKDDDKEYFLTEKEKLLANEFNISYKDVKISKIKRKIINNKNTFIRWVDYKFNGQDSNELYIVFNIKDDLIYRVICTHYEMLTDDELEALFELDISSNLQIESNEAMLELNDEKIIVFNKGDFFEENSSSDSKEYRKKQRYSITNNTEYNNSKVKVDVDYGNLKHYMEYLEKSDEYKSNGETNLSEIMKKTINGREYQYRIREYYDTNGEKHKKVYFACEIEDDDLKNYIYIVEIDNYEDFSEKEIRGLFNIKIENVNN